MKFSTFFTILAACAAVVTGQPMAPRVVMEQDAAVGRAQSWAAVERSSLADTVRITIMMKHSAEQRAKLDEIFWAVSDPAHKAYGRHLSQDELTELMAPSERAVADVQKWLEMAGLKDHQTVPNRDMISVTGTVHQLEALLDTQFGKFRHATNNVQLHRITRPYSLPTHIAEHVSFVGNILRFPRLRLTAEEKAALKGQPLPTTPNTASLEPLKTWPDSCGASCHGKIVPDVLFKQYNIQRHDLAAHGKNKMAVAEFQGQDFDMADINAFFKACGYTPQKVSRVVGPKDQPLGCYLGSCIESLLDIEYILALAQPIPLDVFYLQQFSILNWIEKVASTEDAPWVHSVSYGNDERQQTGRAYMDTVNVHFQKIGARGISIFIASGDQGVWGRSGNIDNVFNPDFPASSPYVTAVGGTDLTTDQFGTEVGCKDSGGGFSNTFPRPQYQQAAVSTYMSSGVTLPAQSYYNATGRGYPDMAALFGDDVPYCIHSGSSWEGVAGTSAACPVVAAQFAKLNDIRLHQNKPTLGFINPLIYSLEKSNPNCFNDITTGDNKSGGPVGFDAYKGWDPVTGLGSPNYGNLAEAITNMQN